MERVIKTTSEAETLALGMAIGKYFKGGEIVLLQSDLGGGKTVLTKGLAEGAGYSGTVSSPTFTLENKYEGRLPILHYDLYRLGELGILNDELVESLQDNSLVKIIEWPEVARLLLRDIPHISITIDRVKSGETHRHIAIAYPEDYNYLFQDRMFTKA